MRFFLIILTLILTAHDLHAHPKEGLDWSYDGQGNGQDQWFHVNPRYENCGTGTQQSPIDITRTLANSKDAKLEFHYTSTQANLLVTRYTPMIVIKDNSYVIDNGETYRLVHIQLRSPSEHTVKGIFSLGEIQLVHMNFQNEPLIISVFLYIDAPLAALNDVLALMPSEPGAVENIDFNPSALIPADTGYFAYTGSLTSPPCTEGVKWRVLKTPISISQAQLESYAKLIGRNARATQPVYIRDVLESP